MTRLSSIWKILLLLLLSLGSFAEELEDNWTFTFPETINTRKHSDVEIPCTFTAPNNYGEVHIVWYKYDKLYYSIIYSEDSSDVLPEYRRRTTLIRNGTNNCSLKIKDVIHTAWYYPGISEEINSFKLKWEKIVQVTVSGCSDEAPCDEWGFTFPRSIDVLKGSCVEIPCKLTYPSDTQTFTLFWYQYALVGYPRIFNSRKPKDVEKKYKGRTSLVGNSMGDCSLRINNVQEPVEIYPGINKEINSYHINKERFCRLSIIEEEPVNITCSVNHTCASSPPSITWNKPDLDVSLSHEDLDQGIWRIKSTIKYIPSYRDGKTQLTCIVTFPNMEISERSVTLDIKYKPKSVTISFIEINQPKEGDNMMLRCTSHANPPLTKYKWFEVGKIKTLNRTGEEISVRNMTSEKYICSASNDIGATNSSVFSFIEQYPAEDENIGNIFIIGGVAGFVTLLILLPVIIVCILKRKKICKKSLTKKNDENRELTYTSLIKRDVAEEYDTLRVVNPTIAIPNYGKIKT
ncbi:B-cell receptor CD22-like [Anomaloglossus baeobatrachus]